MSYGKLTFNGSEFSESATKWRKELLVMPMIGAQRTLQHMTGRSGIAGKEVIGQLAGSIEVGPYDPTRVDDNNVTVGSRVLETYLGSVVKSFDPNSVAKTILGELTAQGDSLKKADIVRQVLNFLAAKLGQSLNMAIWSAKRNSSGTTTKDLFDGFDTITAAEILSGAIAAAKGNYNALTEKITDNNAYDVLTAIYRNAADELKEVPTKLYVPIEVKEAYDADYLKTVGSVVYNTEYKKTYVQGSNGLCEIVGLASKKGSKFLHLAPKSNMLYGYGAGLADENITVEKYHPFLLDFVATMYFGAQFESISPERLFVTELYTPAKYKLSLASSDATKGSVTPITAEGGTEYEEGSKVVIKATPAEGHSFTKWSDDDTNAQRTVTMSQDITLTATFS